LPEGVRLLALANRAGAARQGARPIEVDARGRFIIEDLPAGDYEITLRAAGRLAFEPPRQLVSVPGAGEVNVTLTLDLAARGDRGGRP
jgi:hypothetical protein